MCTSRSETIAAVHCRINCYGEQAQAPLEKYSQLVIEVDPAADEKQYQEHPQAEPEELDICHFFGI